MVQEAPNFNPLRVLLGTLRFNTLFDIDSANILRIDAIEICPWVTLVRMSAFRVDQRPEAAADLIGSAKMYS